jgi:hypothetical protein
VTSDGIYQLFDFIDCDRDGMATLRSLLHLRRGVLTGKRVKAAKSAQPQGFSADFSIRPGRARIRRRHGPGEARPSGLLLTGVTMTLANSH